MSSLRQYAHWNFFMTFHQLHNVCEEPFTRQSVAEAVGHLGVPGYGRLKCIDVGNVGCLVSGKKVFITVLVQKNKILVTRLPVYIPNVHFCFLRLFSPILYMKGLANYMWPLGQIQPCPFMSVFSGDWPTQLKIFTLLPSTEKVCHFRFFHYT